MSMTESEAIRRLKDHFRVHDDGRPTPYLDEAVSMAIHSLEEVQQYRAIGTVKVFETVIKSQMEYCNRMREYEKIGTVSEFRELKEKATEKKPIVDSGKFLHCSYCHSVIRNSDNYCHECGQKLDWSEGQE